jgi:hypothetical protein
MDQAEFDALMATEQEKLGAPPSATPQAAPQQATEAPQVDLSGLAGLTGAEPAAAPPSGPTVDDALAPKPDDGLIEGGLKSVLGTPGIKQVAHAGAAMASGEIEGVFQMKDFLFGETPPEEQSAIRQKNTETANTLTNDSLLGGFSKGIGQFAIAMIGLGKVQAGIKSVEVGAKVVEYAPKTFEILKAALAGASAFDPHASRMSDMVQTTALANPVNDWLSAKPDDSAAMGRLKNAFESIGMDVTLGAVFMGASRVWKYRQAGDVAGAERAAEELNNEITKASVPEQVPAGDVAPASQPGGELPATEGQPAGPTAPDVQATSPEAQPAADPKLLDRAAKAEMEPTIAEARKEISDKLLTHGADMPTGVAEKLNAAVSSNKPEDWDTFLNSYDLWEGNAKVAPELTSAIDDLHNLYQSPQVSGRLAEIKPRLAQDFTNNVTEFRKLDLRVLEDWAAADRSGDYARTPIEREALQTVINEKRVGEAANDAGVNQGGSGGSVAEPVGQAPTEGAAQLGPEAAPVDGTAVTATPSAGQAALDAGTQLNSAQPRIRLSDENTAGLVESMENDAFAFEQFGGWYQAMKGGHVFGSGDKVPWGKFNLPDANGADPEVQNFMARLADATAERTAKIAGGAVLSDKRVLSMVGMMGKLYNADPATIIGMVQRAGKDASTMVTNMEAGYLVANRMLQDTHALAARISLGDFTEFGGFEAAMAELKKRASIAASVYSSARSITSNAARATRRMRLDFAVDPKMVSKLESMDSEQLLKVLSNTEGDPRAVAKVLRSTLWNKTVDALQFLYVNNLVSGLKTQLVNFTTNSYMLGVRPLERMIGGAASGNSAVMKEAVKQYQYMGSSFYESFRSARQAFLSNDSVLAPHKTDVRGTGLEGGADLRTILSGQKPWGSVGGLLANATHIAVAGIGLPTRVLGTVDEMMKQMTYRSKLQASAYMEAVETGTAQGFKDGNLKAFVESFVKDKLYAGFDDAGKATDWKALREAQIATFQQDLLPGSFGRTLQTGIAKHPGLKLIVPFIKTPTNVMRYGWKMTPLLNMAQKEYREMLSGAHGAEAKAQAIGQMTMGTLFMGTAAYMASHGTMTGGGPSDPKAKKALLATGWQPYAHVYENDDGTKTFVPVGRLDPVAIPMGIIVDLMDCYHNLNTEETPEFTAAVGSLLTAMSKQFTSKTYLLGISQFMDAMMDPDRNAEKVIGQTVSNFIPYSAMLRQTNPDPHLRDARSITDKLMTTVPGMGDGVPLVYDPWGEPVMRPGLWSSDDASVVDHEVQRMAIETGSTIEAPSPVAAGVDLRDITMQDGSNAYARYQELAGNPGQGDSLKTIVARKIRSEQYQLAPDGDAGTKGTKLAILADIVQKRRQAAMKHLKQDPVVRDAFRAADLKARAQYVKNKLEFASGQKPSDGGLDALSKLFP